jgi:catechol 2,3-dioxygenase-like lactoylglutathione lyase family enzyme
MPRRTAASVIPLRSELKLFHLERTEDASGVSGIGKVAEGVVFDDGTVVLRWLTEVKSTVVFQSIKDVESVHGHEGKDRLRMTERASDDRASSSASRTTISEKLLRRQLHEQSIIVGGLGYRYFTISVPDIRGLMAQLEAKGIKPTVSITEARPGVTIAMVTDPDGNTVEFLQNTGSK